VNDGFEGQEGLVPVDRVQQTYGRDIEPSLFLSPFHHNLQHFAALACAVLLATCACALHSRNSGGGEQQVCNNYTLVPDVQRRFQYRARSGKSASRPQVNSEAQRQAPGCRPCPWCASGSNAVALNLPGGALSGVSCLLTHLLVADNALLHRNIPYARMLVVP